MKSRRKKVSNCKETIAATNENEKKSSADKFNNENKKKHVWKRKKYCESGRKKLEIRPKRNFIHIVDQ